MNKAIKISIHAIFWLVYLTYSLPISRNMAVSLHIERLILHLSINAAWAVAAFYTFYGYVITFYEKGRHVRYLLISILVCLGCAVVFLPMHFIVNPNITWITFKLAAGSTVGTFIIGQCGSLVRGFENWTNSIKKQAEIENRSLRTENEMLKSQISPHFLFNTLNNIDSFIHNEPDKASETLISLSQILRYMIYETKTEMVPLSKEIECIRSYLTLQKIRIPNNEAVSLSLPEFGGNHLVAPLLFLPFIENAFKHASKLNTKHAIKIKLEVVDEKLVFYCYNLKGEKTGENPNGGFGLENVKRRLELIYKNKYSLEIEKTSGIFEVNLTIQLH